MHIRKHTGEKPNKCNQCPKTFASKGSVYNHMQTHSGGKRYKCSQCNKSFNYAHVLKTHSLIHTGEKPHKCRQCNFSANQGSSLKRHINKHTGEKPHQCNQCDYATINSDNLKKHKRTHSGEKPHRCTMWTVFQIHILVLNFKPWNGAVPEIDICINIPLLHWHKTTTLLQILHNLYWSTDGALGPGIWKNGAKMAIYR